MDEHVVRIDASKKPLVEENIGRIKVLFGVHIALKDENGAGDGQNTLLTLAAGHAPDSVEKAKTYIEAILGDRSGWQSMVAVFDVRTVNMIVKHQDYIESAAQVFVNPDLPHCRVRFQGTIDNIRQAASIIKQLSEEGMPQELDDDDCYPSNAGDQEKESDWRHSSSNDFLESESSISIDGEPLTELRGGVNRTLYGVGQDHLPRVIPDPFRYQSPSDQVLLGDLGLHSAVAELKISSHSGSSEEDSDDNQEIEYSQKDPDFQSKVEFAVKLGYSESHLLKALAKLGMDAGQNELLSELIKQGSVSSQETVSSEHSDASQDLLLDQDDEISKFTSQRKQDESEDDTNLRPIVIDGSNLAMSHGNKEVFSCKGIQLAVDWFRARGHKVITVFVPQWRKETSRSNASIKDQEILTQLEKENVLVFTPSRRINGKRVVCYDDRYVLNLAVETDGIVVSNDNYRDLLNEKAEFKKVVEERLLMYSFVNNRFMPPEDPLGRSGPTLENFLQKEPTVPEPLPPLCPYGSKKCTYGNKCKFYHPERKNMRQKSVTEKLAEDARQRMVEMRERGKNSEGPKKDLLKRSVQRTHSANLSDLKSRTSPVSSALDASHPWTSTSNLDSSEDEERYKQYNQKLAEKLKKMEQDEAMREAQPKPMSEDYGNQAGLMWADNPRSSPVNLNVPGHSNYDNQEFLSGHLLLAKKLSDEAESDKQKSQKENQSEMSESSKMATGGQRQRQSPEPSHTPLQRSGSNKQKLSRQFSLQGVEDPRLKHRTLASKYSHDPRHLGGGGGQQFDPRFVSGSCDYEDSLLSDFQQGQKQDRSLNFPSSAADSSQVPNYPGPVGDLHPMSRDPMSGHVPVSRMVSAPDPFLLSQQSARRIHPMRRQNSTSDPQLHKPDEVEAGSHGSSALRARGTLPMQGQSGSVRFQIGGGAGPQLGSSMHPFSPALQNYPQYCMSEMEFVPHPGYGNMQQQHQQQQQPQQQMGMPYSGRQQGHPMMQSIPHQSQHMGMVPPVSMNYSPMQPQMYGHQGSIWMDEMSSGASSPRQMQPMSVHNTAAPMPPMSMHSVGGTGLTMPGVRQQQSSLPSDTPILQGDPRYKLYYHLCEIFPEAKVRAVMNQHPEETEAGTICSYIIGAK